MLTRRRFTQLGATLAASAALPAPCLLGQMPAPATISETQPPADITLNIAYNGQVPGPILRMKEGRPVTVEIRNNTTQPDLVHWHGLFLPPAVDGAMEEGSPMIPPGGSTRLQFTPSPSGFRWFHTHTFAGKDLRVAQYGGEHGFLWIEPADPALAPPAHDQELFLALHDWEGEELASDDGSMMPVYEISTINGKTLGFGEPLRVRPNTRVLLHILNSSPTEVHWLALAGHQFHVVALDGNPVPTARTVPMLCLAPAERVSAIVEMTNPGVWVLGEVRKHIHAAGMGIVVEYAGASGTPIWNQPDDLLWSYLDFAAPTSAAKSTVSPQHDSNVIPITLSFRSKFRGHGKEELWTINGRSYPENGPVTLHAGQRYRLILDNQSTDAHPVHLHRHTFELCSFPGPGATDIATSALMKDVILAPANRKTHVEFTANNPGDTLFHCHQQNHMDNGFMMLFRYA
jgi:FtsP/CotA-like multicopper oxidase with cupredoxin domain